MIVKYTCGTFFCPLEDHQKGVGTRVKSFYDSDSVVVRPLNDSPWRILHSQESLQSTV
jgi:hypothetical protein